MLSASRVAVSRITEPAPENGFLRSARLEVMPFASVWEQLQAVDSPSSFTVTCSPKHGVDHTVEFALGLAALGHQVVPHVSAKLVSSRDHLRVVLARLADAGIDDLFVIGGDAPTPLGPYSSAGELLEELETCDQRPAQIGVGAYPEGHPAVEASRLMQALLHKQTVATYISTQLCFSAPAVSAWIEELRGAGVDLPLYLGIPGSVQRKKLLEISMKVGVGGSIRYLSKNAGLLKGFGANRTYDPAKLSDSLAPLAADPRADVIGAHIFTFNQVTTTQAWLTTQLCSGGDPAAR